MTDSPNFHAMVRSLLRDRVLDAGADIICAEGWNSVTMSRVAQRVGVSRQMVYKEIGSKEALAEAITSRHADRFLAGVTEQLQAHAGDLVSAFPAAAEYTLRAAADDRLLKAILSNAHGASDGLLPLLTTRPEPVLHRALDSVLEQTRKLFPETGLPEAELASLVEVIVRITLSHLTQPSGPVEEAVNQVRWIARRAIGA